MTSDDLYVPPARNRVTVHSGWSRQAHLERRVPRSFTDVAYRAAGPRERANWDLERADWHASLPFVRTTQAESVLAEMDELISSNRQSVDEAKPAILLNGLAGYGKSALIKECLYDLHRRRARTRVEVRARGSRPIDVVHISARAATSERSIAERLRDFLELPRSGRSAGEITARVLDALFECDVQVVAIDELHFVGQTAAVGRRLSNYIKDLINSSPCTFVFAGNNVLDSEIFTTDRGRPDAAGEQFLSLVGIRDIEPFTIVERDDVWMRTLIAIEESLRLTKLQQGDLFWNCADIMWGKTGGRWRSVTRTVNLACARAIATGAERITPELIASIPVDALAAEHAAKYMPTLGDGTWTSLPRDVDL